MNESFDDGALSPGSSARGSVVCGGASAVSGITSRSVEQCRGGGGQHVMAAGRDLAADDLDCMSVMTGVSSVACSRCSYVTGCDVSDSVSNVFATTRPPPVSTVKNASSRQS